MSFDYRGYYTQAIEMVGCGVEACEITDKLIVLNDKMKVKMYNS